MNLLSRTGSTPHLELLGIRSRKRTLDMAVVGNLDIATALSPSGMRTAGVVFRKAKIKTTQSLESLEKQFTSSGLMNLQKSTWITNNPVIK